MNWNIRVVNCPSENGGDDLLCFKEVYYDEQGYPDSYGDPFVCSETKEGLEIVLGRMKEALDKPTLHETHFGESK